jgi:hypothetical protein
MLIASPVNSQARGKSQGIVRVRVLLGERKVFVRGKREQAWQVRTEQGFAR